MTAAAPVYCTRCEAALRPRAVVWLELNAHTGEWARPGTAAWSGGPESQGAFPLGRDCADRLLEESAAKFNACHDLENS